MKHFLQLGTFLEFQIIFLYYRISSYSFRENYSFLNLEIVANSNSCHNISFFLLNKLNFCCGNYMRKYGSHSIQLNCLRIFNMFIVNDVLINFIFRSSVFRVKCRSVVLFLYQCHQWQGDSSWTNDCIWNPLRIFGWK